ncbi:copper resistance protein CopC [uncultured Methylovirgula sp.]|uniref:copper resistance CopC family protein n=1 Tax=uncultured Methylovirgula sp. TaxID=1285960 RepID=UPI0026058EF1|nr:copper resistance protein CopC [uncultured Methylovirgula sp.]
MQRTLLFIGAVCLAAILPTAAFAHAFLDHAVPSVGTTMGSSPVELELTFTEDIVPAFSGVRVSGPSGAVAIGSPVFGPANSLHVRLIHALKPGTYSVSWHVVSVDTHRTQGTYKFTISP